MASGKPADLTASLIGKIWSKTVSKNKVPEYQENHDLISARLYAGQTVLHVYDENDPGDGFSAVEPGLEDVYFHTLSEVKSTAASADGSLSSSNSAG